MKANELSSKKLLRAIEVAEILDISRAMAYRLMQQGDIPTIRISGSRRVRVGDLEKYISDNVYPPTSRAKSK